VNKQRFKVASPRVYANTRPATAHALYLSVMPFILRRHALRARKQE